uniref:Carboxypeptidase regulatory-like domain-containing protein n=1 Tax=Caenorhabditis tropicalis TaxID=1561998 RepID=A0A1I7U6H3_9PELO
MKYLFGILLLIPFLNANIFNRHRYPIVKIKGTLTCHGEPIKGEIIMIDKNSPLTNHLLTVFNTKADGKFVLAGRQNDESLDVELIIEHKCHKMRIRGGDRLLGYSEISIYIDDLIGSDYDLQFDIELSKKKSFVSNPVIPIRRAWLMGKRFFTDWFKF